MIKVHSVQRWRYNSNRTVYEKLCASGFVDIRILARTVEKPHPYVLYTEKLYAVWRCVKDGRNRNIYLMVDIELEKKSGTTELHGDDVVNTSLSLLHEMK